MVVNNFGSMLDMFSTHYELLCFFIQLKLLFLIHLLGLLIIDQLFFLSINAFILPINLIIGTRVTLVGIKYRIFYFLFLYLMSFVRICCFVQNHVMRIFDTVFKIKLCVR